MLTEEQINETICSYNETLFTHKKELTHAMTMDEP